MHYVIALQTTIFTLLFGIVIGTLPLSANEIQPILIESHGKVITVNTSIDEDNGYLGGGMGISLREAVRYAEEGSIVILPKGEYQLDAENGAGLDIRKDIVLKGSGISKTTISGTKNGSVFNVSTLAQLMLSDLTISNGETVRGGAIYNRGSLIMYAVALTNNRALDGGALYNEGTADLRSCIIRGNNAEYYGGGVNNDGGSLHMTDVGLLRNTAQKGGGLYNQFGYTVMQDGTIFGNVAGSGGGVADYIGMTEITNTSASDNYGGNFEGSVLTLGSNYDSDGTSRFTDGIAGDVVKQAPAPSTTNRNYTATSNESAHALMYK